MRLQFTNQKDNVTWIFFPEENKVIGSYINKFNEPKTDIIQHENEKDFKDHLNTIKRSKDFIKMSW